jgi:hypothetical protein
MGASVSPVTITVDAIGHEQDDSGIDNPGNPESDDNGVINVTPIRRDGRPPPRAPKMENNGAYGQYYEYNYQNHAGFTFLFILLKMKIQKLTINVLLFFISYLVLTMTLNATGL